MAMALDCHSHHHSEVADLQAQKTDPSIEDEVFGVLQVNQKYDWKRLAGLG
jgi:hypothetical protein